jgi:hypothetical protein
MFHLFRNGTEPVKATLLHTLKVWPRDNYQADMTKHFLQNQSISVNPLMEEADSLHVAKNSHDAERWVGLLTSENW